MSEAENERGILKDEFNSDVLKKLKCNDVIRLHLELVDTDNAGEEEDDSNPWQKETIEELHRYGGVQYGKHISRDILAPADIELWALHYVIQRAFGWQNSHLHRFYLSDKRFQAITDGKVGGWANLVGLVFRSPLMDENAQFWADDYDHGNFKTWLRKKYTGPYYSFCQDESFWYIRRHFKEYQDFSAVDDPDAFGLAHSKKAGTARDLPYFVRLAQIDDGNGKKSELFVADCYPESEREQREWRQKAWAKKHPDDPFTYEKHIVKEEVLPWKDLPVDALRTLYFESSTNDLLERLEISFILTLGDRGLPEEGYPILFEDEYLENYQEVIDDAQIALEILDSKVDSPVNQPLVGGVAKELYYNYDFGDNWTVKITGSYNCADLVESERVTQEELDEANLRVRSTYRPVMIARDGLDLVDDLGGYSMIPCFVRAINGDFSKDNQMYEDKEGTIEWAKSLGWSNRKVAMKNRL